MPKYNAHGQGMDPVEFRRRLMKKSPRALATLEKAESMHFLN